MSNKKMNEMKKILTLTLLAAALFVACEKDDAYMASLEPERNRVITIPSDGKTASSTLLVMALGHDAKDCNGCVMFGGKLIHENCMGEGNACATSAAVQLQQIGTDVTATTTDTFDLTSEDFFLMPDRSLNYTDENNNRIFLNIPEQMVYRDTATMQFTFTGLFFSETAAYSND